MWLYAEVALSIWLASVLQSLATGFACEFRRVATYLVIKVIKGFRRTLSSLRQRFSPSARHAPQTCHSPRRSAWMTAVQRQMCNTIKMLYHNFPPADRAEFDACYAYEHSCIMP